MDEEPEDLPQPSKQAPAREGPEPIDTLRRTYSGDDIDEATREALRIWSEQHPV